MRGVVIIFLLLLSFSSCIAANRFSRLSGNWSSTANWSATSGGGSCGCTPLAGDDVFIETNMTLNVSTPLLASVTINATRTLTMNVNVTLSISGALTINGGTPGGSLNKTTYGGGIVAGNISNSGSFSIAPTGTLGAAPAITLGSSISNSGTFTISANTTATLSGSGTITNTGTLNLQGTGLISASSVNNTNTINFTITDQTLQLSGGFSNSGNVNGKDFGIISFTGSNSRLITGAGLYDIRYLNNNSTGSVTIDDGTTVSIYGELASAGSSSFDADGPTGGGTLILASTAGAPTSDGVISNIPATSVFTGNVTVQRYMEIAGSPDTRIYRYISSPVQKQPVSQIQATIPITGPFSGASSPTSTYPCPTCTPGNPSMFNYDETLSGNPNVGYTNFPVGSNSDTLKIGLGYAMYVRGNVSPITDQGSALWSVRGLIKKGTVNLPVTYTSTGSPADDGWNLVGNPYPCAIDWDAAAWTLTNIGPNAYYLDNVSGEVRGFTRGTPGVSINGGSQNIAMCQGFFVKATGSAPALTATEGVKAPLQTTFYRRGDPENLIRISVSNGSRSDETLLFFEKNATDNYDPKYDGFKMKNSNSAGAPFLNLSTITEGNKKLVVNSVSPVSCNTKTVALDLSDVPQGTYTLNFTSIEAFSSSMSIQLLDKFTNSALDLSTSNAYSFTVDPTNSRTFGADRFVLTFSASLPASPAAANVQNCGAGSLNLTASGAPAGGNYRWYTDNVTTTPIAGQNSAQFTTPVLSATTSYFVTSVNANGCESARKEVLAEIVANTTIANVTNGKACRSGSVTLSASGSPAGGSYKWYLSESSTTPIAGQTGAQLITPVLSATTSYFVAMVNSIGCEGTRREAIAEIVSYPDAVVQQLDNTTLSSNFTTGNQWYKNGVIIAGATGQQLKVEESGLYKVVVSVGSCSTSFEGPFVVTGLELTGDFNELVVYPNPTTGEVIVRIVSIAQPQVEIFNNIGQRIGEVALQQGSANSTYSGKFDLSSEANGFYFIRALDAESGLLRVKRLVKK